jgi:hypothetical protein
MPRENNPLRLFVILIVVAYCLLSILPAEGKEHNHRAVRHHISAVQDTYPAPVGCHIVGAFEDATIVAYCPMVQDGSAVLSHGPDATDAWHPYAYKLPRSMRETVKTLQSYYGIED